RNGNVGLLARSVPFDGHSTPFSLLVVSVAEVAGVPVKELLSTEEVRSGWPMAMSAGSLFWVGMEFQINTRFCPRSVTKRCVPSLVTDTGLNMLLEVAGARFLVRSGCGGVVKFG